MSSTTLNNLMTTDGMLLPTLFLASPMRSEKYNLFCIDRTETEPFQIDQIMKFGLQNTILEMLKTCNESRSFPQISFSKLFSRWHLTFLM